MTGTAWRIALMSLALLLAPRAGGATAVFAQDTSSARRDSAVVDSLLGALQQDSTQTDSAGVPVDTARAGLIGLPTAPSRNFPSADSIIEALLAREGYSVTRYASDSLTFLARTSRITLRGSALVEREGATLEADSVRFLQDDCALFADGDPKLFESGTVMVGEGMEYDTCQRQATVRDALTNFNQSGVDWYLGGELGIDSAAVRLYAGDGAITSCDHDDPHYAFVAGRVKWVNNNFMVARPVTLYVKDVPIAWFPFLFQDMRQGRRTGILAPRFGISDIVRPNQGYQRHITNIGYYVAVNDYFDIQASLDWFAGTSVSVNTRLKYRWLDRFVTGDLSYSRIFESGRDGGAGRRSTRLGWTHQQSFDQRTRLSANIDFATSSSVVQQNSIDPFLQTATLRSTLNFSKQYDWGTLSVGGNRSQDLSNDVVTQTFPDVRLTPVPLSIGTSITWSPAFSFSTNKTLNTFRGLIDVPPESDSLQQDSLFADRRNTALSLSTPLRIGRWNWQNSFTVTDFLSEDRSLETVVDPDDPDNTRNVVYSEDFATEIDWNTGINLPMLFASSWKLQPSVGIQNATSGRFMIRNRNTNGRFVQQGKRLSFGATVSPAVFGFFPGVGPLERIRHSVSPQIGWSYAPSARVNEEYLRAVNPNATNLDVESPALHTLRFGLSQTFEGKFRRPEGDTTDTRDARKVKLLSLQTSGMEYDFEQAQEPGRNGWRTQSISNSMTSDLLRGFSLRTSHDLWDGPVGFDTTAFDPFLSSVSARFSISGQTISKLVGALFGGEALAVPADDASEIDAGLDSIPTDLGVQRNRMGRGTSFPGVESLAGGAPRGRGFTAQIGYNDQRQRPIPGQEEPADGRSRNNRTFDVTTTFSPTRFWSLSWTTQYNFTNKEFGQHVLRFDRDLHRWRATFTVVRAPNGNFAFSFFINLLDQPEIKFNYDQRSTR